MAGFDLLEAATGNAETRQGGITHFAYLRAEAFERAGALQDCVENCMSAQLRQEESEEVAHITASCRKINNRPCR